MAPNKFLGKDDELDYIQLYNVKPTFFHFYVGKLFALLPRLTYMYKMVSTTYVKSVTVVTPFPAFPPAKNNNNHVTMTVGTTFLRKILNNGKRAL